MIKTRLIILFSTALYTVSCYSLSTDAVEGKKLYPVCHACHNQALSPPLGPPMWGVQRRYKRSTFDIEDFIRSMVAFVKAPKLESAIHDEAVAQLGLMPPLPLPEEILKKIATYILEEQFLPPCDHWRIAVQRAEKKGNLEHAEKDRNQLKRFCE